MPGHASKVLLAMINGNWISAFAGMTRVLDSRLRNLKVIFDGNDTFLVMPLKNGIHMENWIPPAFAGVNRRASLWEGHGK